MGLDIRMSDELDILSTKGFVQHLFQACRLRKGGAMLVAPVCSTFVFMSLCLKNSFGGGLVNNHFLFECLWLSNFPPKIVLRVEDVHACAVFCMHICTYFFLI